MRQKKVKLSAVLLLSIGLTELYAQEGINIPTGGVITATSAANITIYNGGLVNNGTYIKATETVVFTGNSAKTISGSNTDFYNLLVSNTGGITTQLGLLTANNLTVGSGSKFTIAPAKAVTVSGTTTLNGTESLEIKSDATSMGSFIDNGFSGAGTAKVERWVSTTNPSTPGTRWEYVSSPITAASSSIFTSASHALYYADETQNTYVGIPNGTPQNMVIMQGYTRKYVSTDSDGDIAKTFTGTLNTGAVEPLAIGLTGTTISTVFNGWNLVGNPYPSAMNWDAVSGWTKTNLDNAIYFRNNGNYGSYISGVGTNRGTQYIPPMQAFWVRVTSGQTTGSLTCNNNVRVHNAHNIYKTSSFNNILHITATNNANGLTDDTYILFNPDATDGFDGQYDAYKMFAADSTYPQAYTNNGNDDIAINSLSELLGERTVPLGFKTSISGQFTFTVDMVSSFTDNGNTVYLEDLQTGNYQDLSANSSYQFSSGVTAGLNRFLLHFNPTITDITESAKSHIQIFGYNNEVHIKSLNMLNGDVNVYDLLGQVVATKHLSGTTSDVITLELKSAVYIVKYTTSVQTITEKIVINQ
jgi:hypothetical protein